MSRASLDHSSSMSPSLKVTHTSVLPCQNTFVLVHMRLLSTPRLTAALLLLCLLLLQSKILSPWALSLTSAAAVFFFFGRRRTRIRVSRRHVGRSESEGGKVRLDLGNTMITIHLRACTTSFTDNARASRQVHAGCHNGPDLP